MGPDEAAGKGERQRRRPHRRREGERDVLRQALDGGSRREQARSAATQSVGDVPPEDRLEVTLRGLRRLLCPEACRATRGRPQSRRSSSRQERVASRTYVGRRPTRLVAPVRQVLLADRLVERRRDPEVPAPQTRRMSGQPSSGGISSTRSPEAAGGAVSQGARALSSSQEDAAGRTG
jgi:hypothetical protein